MAKVKVAVLGTGSLGQHHARIYAELHAAGAVELTGIYDAHADTAHPGDVTSVTDPDARVASMTYDPAGNLATSTTTPTMAMVVYWRRK